jgi:putative ABC transport system permease protein
MAGLIQDLRYGLRVLGKAPGFTAVAVITLALGIGANSAIFSVVTAVLLHPYAFPQIDRLVILRERRSHQVEIQRLLAPADFIDLAREDRSYQTLAAFRYADFNLTGTGDPVGVVGCEVSDTFFDTLQVQPAQGRAFSTGEELPGRNQVAIVSYRFWQNRLGADPGAVGKTINLDGRAFAVLAIMPRDFAYPLGVEMWTPLALSASQKAERTTESLRAVARLRPEVSFRQADAEMRLFAGKLAQLYPRTNQGQEISLVRLRDEQFEYYAPFLLTLQGAALFVLLLAWANVANLLLAQVIARRKETAIRAALGASRSRLAQQVLTEMLTLSLLAGTAAVSLSFWGVNLIKKGIPPRISMWISGWGGIGVDGFTLGITALLTLLAGMAFAGVATARASGLGVNSALKEGGRGSGDGMTRHRLRSLLVVTEVATALVLLVGAGLMTKGFLHLVSVYRGFDPGNVLTVTTTLPEARYPDGNKISNFYRELLRRVESLPGVGIAGLVENLPANGLDNRATFFTIEGRPSPPPSELPSVDLQSVSPGFFQVFRIPLERGREFSEDDGANSARAVIVSQSLAARFWPRQDPLGQRLRLGRPDLASPWLTVVGVVGDYVQNWWDPPRPTLYIAYLQAPRRSMALVIRGDSDPMKFVPAVRSALQRIDPAQPLFEVRTMPAVIQDSLASARVMGTLMMVFAALALILAAVGVYGVFANSVTQRKHEFGIRLALGARSSDVLRHVMSEAAGLCGTGLAAGIPISLALSYTMAALLYGLVALDFIILAGFTCFLGLVGLAAAYFPARRATQVDPIVALRHE